MDRNSLRSRVFVPVALALSLAGCRAHTVKQGSAFQVQTGTAVVEKRKTDKKASKVKEYLRRDGSTRLRVTEKNEETDQIDRDLLEKMAGASIDWRQDVTRPWWQFPLMLLAAAGVGAVLALLISWRIVKWKRGLLGIWP